MNYRDSLVRGLVKIEPLSIPCLIVLSTTKLNTDAPYATSFRLDVAHGEPRTLSWSMGCDPQIVNVLLCPLNPATSESRGTFTGYEVRLPLIWRAGQS